MNKTNFIILVLVLTTSVSQAAPPFPENSNQTTEAEQGYVGNEGGGGGHVLEIKFQEIATNIAAWLNSPNVDLANLNLPSGVTLADYKEKMLKEISNYNVEYKPKPVDVVGHNKQCRSHTNSNGKNQIICNSLDVPTDINEFYKLVHHEFAGLAKLEKNIGAESDYFISSQISAYLRQESVMRLPILPQPPSQKHAYDKLCDTKGSSLAREYCRQTFSKSEYKDLEDCFTSDENVYFCQALVEYKYREFSFKDIRRFEILSYGYSAGHQCTSSKMNYVALIEFNNSEVIKFSFRYDYGDSCDSAL